MVLDSGPMIKRLFTTLVVSFGMMSSSASTVSDSLPVCSIERLPTPLSSTASKPLTFLDSCVSFAGEVQDASADALYRVGVLTDGEFDLQITVRANLAVERPSS